MTINIQELQNLVNEHWRNKFNEDKFKELCSWVESYITNMSGAGHTRLTIDYAGSYTWICRDEFTEMIGLELYRKPLIKYLETQGFTVTLNSYKSHMVWDWWQDITISWVRHT